MLKTKLFTLLIISLLSLDTQAQQENALVNFVLTEVKETSGKLLLNADQENRLLKISTTFYTKLNTLILDETEMIDNFDYLKEVEDLKITRTKEIKSILSKPQFQLWDYFETQKKEERLDLIKDKFFPLLYSDSVTTKYQNLFLQVLMPELDSLSANFARFVEPKDQIKLDSAKVAINESALNGVYMHEDTTKKHKESYKLKKALKYSLDGEGDQKTIKNIVKIRRKYNESILTYNKEIFTLSTLYREGMLNLVETELEDYEYDDLEKTLVFNELLGIDFIANQFSILLYEENDPMHSSYTKFLFTYAMLNFIKS